MGKAHRPWEELEGQRLRIDVGSTKEEALASQENSTIYFTKDKSIVMNGVAFSDGTAQHPVMVNVCRAIPTRPRKGQVYFFENRVFYRLHRDKMQDGETFSLSDCQIALGGNGMGLSILPPPYPESITKSNWPAGEFSPEILIIEYKHQCFVRVEKDGFVGEQGVLRFMKVEDFISGHIVPTSPNFEFRRYSGYFMYQEGSKSHHYARLRVRCIAEPPVNGLLTSENLVEYATFLLRAKKHRCLINLDLAGFGIKQYPITDDSCGPVRCNKDDMSRENFFIIASKRRWKASVKKAFVKKSYLSPDAMEECYVVQPLREK